jgi:hypothetical protein
MATAATPSFHASSCLEKVLEHRFLAEVTSTLWRKGITDFEVLQSQVDSHGYDVVIEALGVIRHIQLKAMVHGGKRQAVGVNQRLAAKPSGCVIWMVYDPATLELGPFYWFGGAPGHSLAELGDRVARHTRGNSDGLKAERPGHRLVAKSRFALASDAAALVQLLFGPASAGLRQPDRDAQVQLVLRHLRAGPFFDGPDWLADVRDGNFSAIPAHFDWESSCELAHLIDGYAMLAEANWGDPFAYAEHSLRAAARKGEWLGGPAELWTSLFLEHRRWRMAGTEPHAEARELLDRLCGALRTLLQSASVSDA